MISATCTDCESFPGMSACRGGTNPRPCVACDRAPGVARDASGREPSAGAPPHRLMTTASSVSNNAGRRCLTICGERCAVGEYDLVGLPYMAETGRSWLAGGVVGTLDWTLEGTLEGIVVTCDV